MSNIGVGTFSTGFFANNYLLAGGYSTPADAYNAFSVLVTAATTGF
jgi:hypothetical protein